MGLKSRKIQTVNKLVCGTLPADDIAELRYFFEEFPSQCGLKSFWWSQAEIIATEYECECGTVNKLRVPRACRNCGRELVRMAVKDGHGEPSYSPFDSISLKDIGKSRRVWKALTAMIDRGWSRDVTVLYRMHGDQWRYPPFLIFGPKAAIVEYTDLVKRKADDSGMSVREYLDKHLRGLSRKDKLVQDISRAADAMLTNASKRYLACK